MHDSGVIAGGRNSTWIIGLVSSFVYELPFGRGKKFGGNMNKAADLIIGGWQVNAIATFQNGFPLTFQRRMLGGFNDTFGTNRANLVGTPKTNLKPLTSGSTHQRSLSLRRASWVLLDAAFCALPGINNWDTGLFKNFAITEKVSFQFRFESFNAFNHTQWEGPNRNVADTTVLNGTRTSGVSPAPRAARINQLGAKIVF